VTKNTDFSINNLTSSDMAPFDRHLTMSSTSEAMCLEMLGKEKEKTLKVGTFGDRCLSDITNRSQTQTRPEGLCGTWTKEYKSPHCDYSKQHVQETYKLLSCGVAYQSKFDRYDEGSDYFSESKTAGWGRWHVRTDGALIIVCSAVTSTSFGGSVCGNRTPLNREHFSSDSQLRESIGNFAVKYTRQGSLNEEEEEKLRAQMRHALKKLPPKAKSLVEVDSEVEEDCERITQLPLRTPCQARCAPKESSRTGALNGLRRYAKCARVAVACSLDVMLGCLLCICILALS
jgi:hypothetical protein